MIKKMVSSLAAVMLAMGSWAMAGPAEAASKKHAGKLHGCQQLMVKGKAAWLKNMPHMGARTLRTARHGEQFWLVTDAKGRAHHTMGWWLVKNQKGYRYWAHQSVLACK